QRRHQKVVEERPSPLLDESLRAAMGAAAVKAAAAIGYTNAGTIEFLVDRHRDFYLLEMNTRLQVEHPITELTCGQDLVRWQLLVAAGERLPLSQEQIRHEGHAIEVRVCAEDADHGFLPASGRVQRLELPGGPGVRVDGCLYEGLEVTPYYDPLLAKVCVHAATRELAIARMRRALAELTVTGVITNLPFLRRVLDSEAFRSGRYDTTTLEGRPAEFARRLSPERERSAALIAATMAHVLRGRRGFPDRATGTAPAAAASVVPAAPPTRSSWVDTFRPGSDE
ncbi:MAG TPA: hypothetical protein VMV01_09390, partial [Planctomycetota bacterium]|nr:hypothetical protein [Planctomycetota bacterium]